MGLDAYRQSLVTAVEAAKATFATYPLVIEYDNRLIVNPETQTNPYLCVEVKFIEGYQADLSASPTQRILGQLLLSANVKLGSGSAQALNLIDHFQSALQRKSFGSVRTHMGTFVKPQEHLGNWIVSAVIPFWVDRIT